jgi:hypothetical protein
MNKIGEISYPVYVIYLLVLLVAPTILLVAVTIVFSRLLVRWVVEPVEVLRQR